MSNGSPEPRIIEGSDVIFECPQCSKSMAIDRAAAGLLINCPECSLEIQVPGVESINPGIPEPGEPEPSITIAQDKVQLLVESFDEINSRREKLERMRTDTLSRFDRIHEQLSIMQSAIDRVTLILQEASSSR